MKFIFCLFYDLIFCETEHLKVRLTVRKSESLLSY